MATDVQGNVIQLEGGELGSKESEFNDKEYTETTKAEAVKGQKMDFDIFNTPINKIKSLSTSKKIHWSIAIALNIICVFVWRYATKNPSESFWWWIIPMFACATSLTLHHNIEENRYLNGIVNASIILNVLLFTINILTMSHDKFFIAWWVYPAIVTAMVIYPLYQYVYKSEQHKSISNALLAASPTATIVPYQINWSKVIIFEYACISLILFFTWVNVKMGHPWFIYPILVLASPILYWRMKSSEKRVWMLLIPQLLILNAIIFVAWAFTSSKVPWFLPVFILSCCAIAIMFLVWKKRQSKEQAMKEEQNDTHKTTDPEDIVIE